MMKKLLLGGFLGGATLFVWGFVSWTVLSWHSDTLRQDDGIMAVVENIEEHLPETGVYYFPPMLTTYHDAGGMEEYVALHKSGPSGMIFYTAEHRDPMRLSVLVWGFIAYVVAAGFATLLLMAAASNLRPYWSRVIFIAALGIFTILSAHVIDSIFINQQLRFTVGLAADTAIGWTLAGLVIGGVVRTRTPLGE